MKPNLETLRQEVRRNGLTPSSRSFEDEQVVYACSTETVYGHPQFEVSFNKETGWVRACGTVSFEFNVFVEELGGRWFIKMGFANFNSRANNSNGYPSSRVAVEAIRKLDPTCRNYLDESENFNA